MHHLNWQLGLPSSSSGLLHHPGTTQMPPRVSQWPHVSPAGLGRQGLVTPSAAASATVVAPEPELRVVLPKQLLDSLDPDPEPVAQRERRSGQPHKSRPRTPPAADSPANRPAPGPGAARGPADREAVGQVRGAQGAPSPGEVRQQRQVEPAGGPPRAPQQRPKWQEEALRQRQEYLRQQQEAQQLRDSWQHEEPHQQQQQPQQQRQQQQWQRQQQQWQRQPRRPLLRQQVQQQEQRSAGAGASRGAKGDGHALQTGLALTWLGTNSGTPTQERNVSCTLVRMPGAVQMVDCGEGTQRQLLNFPAVQLAEVDGIFITHMHGDHCFGLPATLALLDEAKAKSQTDPARRRNHVYGPPGLAELVRASMLLTGLSRRLQLPLTVTEFVCSPASAHPPRPLEEPLQQDQPQQPQRGRGQAGASGGGDAGPGVFVQRLAPRYVRDVPELQAAARAVQDRVASLEEIWFPPRNHPVVQMRGGTSGSDSDADVYGSLDEEMDEQNAPLGGGGGGGFEGRRRPWVAAEGLFWEVPGCAGVRVRAAQLQHRVACWGYVFQEQVPASQGAKRRKVVVLGDTVSSRAIAPLAAGCDVLSHEATFAAGMEDKARVAQHSTGRMAGAFAGAVGARQLVLTHFSSRYREEPDVVRNIRVRCKDELEQQTKAVGGLLREASQAFGRPSGVFAASDFYTHHVQPRVVAGGDRPAGAAAAAEAPRR